MSLDTTLRLLARARGMSATDLATAIPRAGVATVSAWLRGEKLPGQDQLEAHIPFIGALLKKEQDAEALQRFDAKSGRYPTSWKELGPRYNQ